MLVAALVIGGVVAVLALFVIVSYNKLVRLRARIDESWAQIDVQLRRRFDLIPNLVSTVKGYAAHERETLEAVISARTAAVSATTPAAAAAADGLLTASLGKLLAVAEAYPQLKADGNFAQLQAELTATEGRVAYARQLYNEVVRAYETARQTFPTVLVAGPLGFAAREYFATDGEARDNVVVEF